MSILVVVILILIYVVALEGVSSFIIVSFSSFIKLLVFYNNRDGLIFGAATGPGVYNFDIYNLNIYGPGVYSLSN